MKLPRYAANGVREAWLVDLKARRVEVHSKPRDGQFTKRTILAPGDLVTSTVVSELVLSVDDILP